MFYRFYSRKCLYVLIIVLFASLICISIIPTFRKKHLKIAYRYAKRKISDLNRGEDASQNLLDAGFDEKYKENNRYPIPKSDSNPRRTEETKEEEEAGSGDNEETNLVDKQLSNTEKSNSPYDFNQINLGRLKLIKQTCHEMKKDESLSYRTTNLTKYKSDKAFIDKFTLRQSDFDYPRFAEAWKYTKDKALSILPKYKGETRAKWIMCLPPKHGTSNWQRSIIASMKNTSSDQIVWNSYLYKMIPNLGNKARLSEIVDTIVSAEKKILLARHPINKLHSATF